MPHAAPKLTSIHMGVLRQGAAMLLLLLVRVMATASWWRWWLVEGWRMEEHSFGAVCSAVVWDIDSGYCAHNPAVGLCCPNNSRLAVWWRTPGAPLHSRL